MTPQEERRFPLLYKASTESTNDDARAWAQQGAEHGTVVWAEVQTKGRGRRGAAWMSQSHESLAFSVILRPKFSRALWPRISLICGLAVCKVLEKHGLIAEVKWPNDVMVQQKKVCGILIEASESAVIAGIGINVNVSDFPNELKSIATSMLIECGKNFDRQEILSEIQQSLIRHLLRVDNDFTSIIQELRERCYLTGKSVRMLVANQEMQGTVQGIGKNGELMIDHAGRRECYLQADEIRIVS